jgi:hypothetical protein
MSTYLDEIAINGRYNTQLEDKYDLMSTIASVKCVEQR